MNSKMTNKKVEALVDPDVLTLYLVRGLPGSGKSTIARSIADTYGFVHSENDEYFMKNGKYCFDQNKVKDAANWCFKNIETALKNGKSAVVSNVFVTRKSILRYKKLANSLNARFVAFRTNADFGNLHSVPAVVYRSMKNAFEDFTDEIDVTPA